MNYPIIKKEKLQSILFILFLLHESSCYDFFNNYRLPTSIQPLDYKLKIITKFENAPNITFQGEVIIHFKVISSTDNITLHACNLTIDDTLIKLKTFSDNQVSHCVVSVTIVRQLDFYIMKLCRTLPTGEEAKIKLPFRALLNDRLVGYYKSSYRVKDSNSTKWLSVTQFEATFARAAFPCLDEPIYKAKFIIWLGHHHTYTALSNMPLQRQQTLINMTGYVWSIFEESVPMSTYLVAFSVNKFEYKPSDLNRITFRTWSRPEAIDQCEYASIIAPRILRYFEDSFGIAFPLKKIDLIAVPDFAAGAMENWGLITFRETSLLYSSNSSSESHKQGIADTISHELAHQWFGNLVTMKWWNDLWLNEGFATYMSSLAVEYLNPDWQFWYEESLESILIVFRRDALANSHPVTQSVQSSEEIGDRFDAISYRKGCLVLRMLDIILGRDAFLQSLKRYLTAHKYNNSNTDDLWAAFTEISHFLYRIDIKHDIKTIMDSWTLQTGYPMVQVLRDYKNKSVQITQKVFHYVYTPNRLESEKCWWIPLTFTTASVLDFSVNAPSLWMECDYEKHSVPLNMGKMAADEDWLLFNIQISGLYRVMYDLENWAKLNRTLNSEHFSGIHVMNRAQIIDDVLCFAWSGYQDYDLAFDILSYLMREREYLPWMTALANLSNLNRLLRNFNTLYETFLSFMRKIIRPVYYYLDGLNFTQPEREMSHIRLLHKSLIGGWACHLEIDDCVQSALRYFNKWQSSELPDFANNIPVNVRAIVYCTAIRHGNKTDWTFLWDRYQATNVAIERHTILIGLSCTHNKKILHTFMRLAFAWGEFIPPRDSSLAFAGIARNKMGFQMAKSFFLQNIGQLYDFYSPNTEELGNLVLPLASQIIKVQDLKQLQEILEQKSNLLRKSSQHILNALDIIKVNMEWIQRNVVKVKTLFENRDYTFEPEDIF